MTSCLKCGREVKGSGKVAHLLCQKCRRIEDPRPKRGARTHIVDEGSVARLSCRVTTLCGRNADNVHVAEYLDTVTCQRCLQIRQIRARNLAYRVALKLASLATREKIISGDTDHLLCEALDQIAKELELRANGQLQARVVGPKILKRAGERNRKHGG